ncbi:Biotin carboxyl carrier protein [Olavius algarvensis Delta 1 endosymbiont]|nr:Biotin carboxyl carrier protein [Olavius algarvensis Delta 1 endosymbiont]
MNRLDIIQHTIDKKDARHYLEIGVKKGKVFLKVKAPRKIAVDPNFKISFKKKLKACRKDTSNIFNKYYEMISDEFFKRYHRRLERLDGIDVAFIDGLHTYQQTLIDVQNCLTYLSPNGVIIMHDCNPASEAEALAVASREQSPRFNAQGQKIGWSGDVWKTIAHLRSTRHDLNIFVLDCDSGVSIITKGSPEDSLDFTPEMIENLAYEDLVTRQSIVLSRHAALRAAYSGRFLLFDIIIR